MLLISHTGMHEQIHHNSENKDTIFQMEVDSMILLKLKNSFGIDGNKH